MAEQPPGDLAWDDVRLVKAVADTGSLPGAAARLGVNHSTVFRRLARMEAELGAKLFERHRGGYAPTPVGEELCRLGSRFDEGLTDLARKLAGREMSPTGEVRVTTNDTLLVHLLTPAFARFRQRFPGVRLDVVLSNRSLNLSRRDADVAVRATDDPPENLVGRRVAGLGWALYARADAMPADGSGPAELDGRDWIALGDGFGALQVYRHVAEHVARERIVYRVNSVLGLAEAVETGIGIGFLPCFIADGRPGLVRLSPPEPAFEAGLWLLTHPDLRRQTRVRALLDFLAADLARQRDALSGVRDGAAPAADPTAAADPAAVADPGGGAER